MGLTIKPLAQTLVHRITAGEVIDSMAAAVRELVDNALDAQADRISLIVWPQDWSLQLSDNGCGLGEVDLASAAQPHSTSKLSNQNTLQQIRTLGFRGEALHSLAQLGQLEIRSRSQQSDDGWQATYNHQGEMVCLKPVAIAPGTIIRVTHLFGQWPSRQQTLQSVSQQLKSIQGIIYNYALCHPHITWQIWQSEGLQSINSRLWFSVAAGKNTQAILPQVLRSIDPSALRSQVTPLQDLPPSDLAEQTDQPIPQQKWGDPDEISELYPQVHNQLEVMLGLPDRCHRHRPDWLRVAVNGRCVKVNGDPASTALLQPIEQTILRAFRQTLPRHRYPLCFVQFKLHPSYIDWNRHPAKTEIYLRGLEHWRSQLFDILQQMLSFSDQDPVGDTSNTIKTLLKTSEHQGQYHLEHLQKLNHSEPLISTYKPETLTLSDALPLQPSLMALKAIAQASQTYIVAEHNAGIWLVEQHIAHERVLYESLQDNWNLVELTPPLRLPGLSLSQVNQLEDLGLNIEAFGHDVWAVRSIPKILVDRSDRLEAILELSRTDNLSAALASTACRSAIRNGTPLTLPEMQTLLDRWQKTQNPRTCPHGRPIYLSLEESDLARFFRRHWMIGKSHGLQ